VVGRESEETLDRSMKRALGRESEEKLDRSMKRVVGRESEETLDRSMKRAVGSKKGEKPRLARLSETFAGDSNQIPTGVSSFSCVGKANTVML
jgi:hypothetical protein